MIWAIYAPELLSARVSSLLQDPGNELLFSYASLQELLNKVGRGRLRLISGSVPDVLQRIEDVGVQFAAFTVEDIVSAASLIHHHSDPFDRILIAQAQALSIPLVTVDNDIRKYQVQTIWD